MDNDNAKRIDPQQGWSPERVNEFANRYRDAIYHCKEQGSFYVSPARYFLVLAAFLREAKASLNANEYMRLLYAVGIVEEMSTVLIDLIAHPEFDAPLKAALDKLDIAAEAMLNLPPEVAGWPVLDFRSYSDLLLMTWGRRYPNYSTLADDPFDTSEERFVESRLKCLEQFHCDNFGDGFCGSLSCAKCHGEKAAV